MAFTHYRAFSVDHLKVDTNNQTNFPVRIAGTYAWAAGTGSGGRSQNASGFDIRPFTDTGLSAALTYQLSSYNTTTGAFSMVVLVPSLSHTVDYVFYIGIGNAALTTDGSSTSVWDANFKAVYAFGDGTTLSLADSTSNGNTLTNVGGTASAGPYGGAISFNGTTQYAERTASAPVTTMPVTIESVFKPAASVTTTQVVVGLNVTAGLTIGFETEARATDAVRAQSGPASTPQTANGVLSSAAWNYAAAITNTSTDRRLLVNGAAAVTSVVAGTPATPDNISIGVRTNNSTHNSFFAGAVGEVRISNIVRADDWTKTTYNNLVGIATFYSVGSEVAVGGGARRRIHLIN